MLTPVTSYGPNTPVSNIVIPREGPRALEVTLNFANTASILIEGLLATTTGQISYIQGLYIDNGDNPEPLTVIAKTTNQRIIAPAYSQGYWPILFAAVPDCSISTTQADITVYIHFYNVPIQSQYWLVNDAAPIPVVGAATAANQALEIAALGLLDTDLDAISAQLPATLGAKTKANSLSIAPATDATFAITQISGGYTDRSIVNLAGTSETLMAANASRQTLVIQNVAANNIGVNLTGGTAAIGVAGTITLVPGASMVLDTRPPVGAITIIGTAGDDVTAYEG